jgi:hypothetical protein
MPYLLGMMALISASESGTLLLLGGGLVVASLVLRRALTTVARAFGRGSKASLSTQESPLK